MKRKNWLIISATAVLLLTVLAFLFSPHYSTLRDAENAFSVSDTSSVVKISMADKSNHEVVLEKKKPGNWVLNDSLIASQDNVEKLLEVLKKLRIDHPVSNARRSSTVSRLKNHSITVEIYQKQHWINIFDKIKLFPYESNTKTFFVGKETHKQPGAPMLMKGADRPFLVGIPGSETKVASRFSTRFSDWRSGLIFNSDISNVESLTMRYQEASGKSFRIEIEDRQYIKVFDLDKQKYIPSFDTVKVIEYLSAYKDLRLEKWLNNFPQQKIDSLTKGKPAHVITLKENSGDIEKVKTYRKKQTDQRDMQGNVLPYDPDRMYATINNGSDFVMVEYFEFDKILKPVSYFLTEH